MRVISGKYKGHQLVSFTADNIRPTTDRVKETIFNKLMGCIEGARFLDLFSGTGNLAIEAHSRGAGSVCAVENHRKSLQIIAQNLKKLKISEGIEVINRDVFKFLESYEGEPFDVILVDPPFTRQWAHEVMTALAPSRACGPQTVIIIEVSSKERIDDEYGRIQLTDRRQFGDKNTSFFTCAH